MNRVYLTTCATKLWCLYKYFGKSNDEDSSNSSAPRLSQHVRDFRNSSHQSYIATVSKRSPRHRKRKSRESTSRRWKLANILAQTFFTKFSLSILLLPRQTLAASLPSRHPRSIYRRRPHPLLQVCIVQPASDAALCFSLTFALSLLTRIRTQLAMLIAFPRLY